MIQGSQIRETLAASGMTLVSTGQGHVTLQGGNGIRELWSQNDSYAGYVIEIDGMGYEFVRSLPTPPPSYTPSLLNLAGWGGLLAFLAALVTGCL